MRHSTEDTNYDEGDDCCTEYRLQEDGILDLAQRRLLDPYLPIENLADDVALLILCNPRLILVAIAGRMR